MATNQQDIDGIIHDKPNVELIVTSDQPSESYSSSEPYLKTKEQLRSINREIKDIREQLKKVAKRLDSWGLAAMESIGLAVDNVAEDAHLFVLPNSKLSRHDLARKQELLNDRVSELAAQLRSEYAIIRQLKLNARLERQQQLGAYAKQYRYKVIDEYKANSKKFFVNNTPDVEQRWNNSNQEIFRCADKLIIVSEVLTEDTDIVNLWQGWKVVSKARELITAEYNSSVLNKSNDKKSHRDIFQRYEKYLRGAKEYLKNFTFLLPPGLQGIQLLYMERDFARVDFYLQEVFSKSILSNDTEYLQLISNLQAEVHDVCLVSATRVLNNLTGFAGLTQKVAHLLVQQQAYLLQLKFDLKFLRGYVADPDIKKIHAHVNTLEEHIRTSCNKKYSITTLEAEFDKIKLQIDIQAQELQNMLLPNNNTPLPEPLTLGSGLGLGWLYGIQHIPTQIYVAGQDEGHDKISLADNIDESDYKFILAEDSFWQENIKPYSNTVPTSVSTFSKVANYIRRTLINISGEQELSPSYSVFIIPEKLILAMEKIAPGFGAKIAAHFQRRANDLHMAIEEANKINDTDAADVIMRDLEQLETEWVRIMRAVHDPLEFCTVVDLYLTSRYSLERQQYIEISRDLRRQPYIEQERKILLFEYQHERTEIQELHNLKEILQQVVRPNR